MVTGDDRDRTLVLAEASAWLARLQSDERTAATDAAFKAWLAADPENSAAFELAADVWENLPGAAEMHREMGAVHAPRLVRGHAAPARQGRPIVKGLAIAASVSMIALFAGYAWLTRPLVYETAPGEQQVTTLKDGSRVSLNTDTRIAVTYGGGYRRVRLERGEAIFDVAHDPAHPFLVSVEDEQVRAVGTSFLVRRGTDDLSVALITGKIEISRRNPSGSGDSYVPQTLLVSGERATVDNGAHVTIDRPSLDNLTAWRRGQVVFQGVTLMEAANEMNRYGPDKIVMNDPAVARLRVSGVFETNDALEFAKVMAQLNSLKVRVDGQTIELSR